MQRHRHSLVSADAAPDRIGARAPSRSTPSTILSCQFSVVVDMRGVRRAEVGEMDGDREPRCAEGPRRPGATTPLARPHR
eukprot:350629-Prymnesium_polylepis.1